MFSHRWLLLNLFMVIMINVFGVIEIVSMAPTSSKNASRNVLESNSIPALPASMARLAQPPMIISPTTMVTRSQASSPPTRLSLLKSNRQVVLNLEHRLRDVVPVNLHRPCDSEPLISSPESDYYEPVYIDAIEQLEAHYEHEAEEAAENVDLDAWLAEVDKNKTSHVPKSKFGYTQLQKIITKTHKLQALVTDLVRKSLINECHDLPFKPLVHLPTNLTKNSELTTAVKQIYRTLANQTSHLYFIWARQHNQTRLRASLICEEHQSNPNVDGHHQHRQHQQQQQPQQLTMKARLKLKKENARRLSDHFMLVGDSLRQLMCSFHRTFHLFGVSIPTAAIVDQVLEHRIHSSTLCVRQSLLDCLIMRNAIATFAGIEQFLRDNLTQLMALR